MRNNICGHRVEVKAKGAEDLTVLVQHGSLGTLTWHGVTMSDIIHLPPPWLCAHDARARPDHRLLTISNWSKHSELGSGWSMSVARYRPLSSCHTTCDTGDWPGRGAGIVNNEIRLAQDLRALLSRPDGHVAILTRLDIMALVWPRSDIQEGGGETNDPCAAVICILSTRRGLWLTLCPAYLDWDYEEECQPGVMCVTSDAGDQRWGRPPWSVAGSRVWQFAAGGHSDLPEITLAGAGHQSSDLPDRNLSLLLLPLSPQSDPDKLEDANAHICLKVVAQNNIKYVAGDWSVFHLTSIW